jgi:ABC-type phosphate/phosphonate transport system permease subunit
MNQEPNSFNNFMKKLTTKTYTFTNEKGETKVVVKKRSKALVFGALFLVLFLICVNFTSSDTPIKWNQIHEIFSQLFVPSKWSLKTDEGYKDFLFNTAIPRIWDTVKMVYIATIIGTLISVPLYILAARNVVE